MIFQLKKKYFIFLFFSIVLSGYSINYKSEKKLIKRAEKNVERGNIKQAKYYYQKALENNPESYQANLGMGILLCELLDNYHGALPYLEKALTKCTKDTLTDLSYALGKCYQNEGNYETALFYYKKLEGLVDYDNEIDFSKEIKKREEDCRFATEQKYVNGSSNIFIVNAGKKINSDMPEYVPVLTPSHELIFTSKRKDSEKETVSYLDGKYYESMYITEMSNRGLSSARRYTLPDQFSKSKFRKHHESIISLSQDGKKLFLFRNNKIYEEDLSTRGSKDPQILDNHINRNMYQNHAYLSMDGTQLFFTAEFKDSKSGLDIYLSTKTANGSWGDAVNLGDSVNTSFDEEAPFLSADGKTLFFASKGHEGFGNYDMYKSNLVNGSWTKAQNLGKPVNSSANDIFMVSDSAVNYGFFSSSRAGGFGDMDIYKLFYLDKLKNLKDQFQTFTLKLSIENKSSNDYKSVVNSNLPSNFRVIEYEWKIDGQTVTGDSTKFNFDSKAPGVFKISYKLLALCDTCLNPMIAEDSIENVLTKIPDATDTILAKKGLSEMSESELHENMKSWKGVLSREQLLALGFNMNSVLFDLNKSVIRKDAEEIITHNEKIIAKYQQLSVKIVGYTDSRGTETRNIRLSKERAANVKNHYLKNGVEKSQIKFIEAGSYKNLVNDCGKGKACDEAAHQQNRRIEMIISIE